MSLEAEESKDSCRAGLTEHLKEGDAGFGDGCDFKAKSRHCNYVLVVSEPGLTGACQAVCFLRRATAWARETTSLFTFWILKTVTGNPQEAPKRSVIFAYFDFTLKLQAWLEFVIYMCGLCLLSMLQVTACALSTASSVRKSFTNP